MKFPTMTPLKRLTAASAILSALAFTACSSPHPVPVNYAPSSVLTATGATGVGDFTYLPAEPASPNHVDANQIRNTAMGSIHIDRDVKVFVRDAVFAELRFVGIKTGEKGKMLTGEIQEFLIDDLGYSIDWTLRIKYVVTDAATQKVLFESVKSTQRKTAKFANAFGAMNETIKLNVEDVLKDPAFTKAIN